jgi:hypothetical protein
MPFPSDFAIAWPVVARRVASTGPTELIADIHRRNQPRGRLDHQALDSDVDAALSDVARRRERVIP